MPATLELSRRQILGHRRAVGWLDTRMPRQPVSLRWASWAGLQDSMPRAALLSLHARVEDVAADALDDPALIQVWGPRYACYVIAAEDLGIFTLGRLPEEPKRRERDIRIAAGLKAMMGEGITDDRRMGIELGGHPNALKYATTTGTVRIRWDGSHAPDIWIVEAPDVNPAEARCELARRHLRIFGPATPASFAEWAGVSKRAATEAYRELYSELIPTSGPLGEGWIHTHDEHSFQAEPVAPAPARLLPSGDAYTLLWGDERELLVPDAELRARLWTTRVWPGAVLIDGEIAGTWRRAGAQLTVEAWTALSPAQRGAVEAEAAALPLPGLDRAIDVIWAPDATQTG